MSQSCGCGFLDFLDSTSSGWTAGSDAESSDTAHGSSTGGEDETAGSTSEPGLFGSARMVVVTRPGLRNSSEPIEGLYLVEYEGCALLDPLLIAQSTDDSALSSAISVSPSGTALAYHSVMRGEVPGPSMAVFGDGIASDFGTFGPSSDAFYAFVSPQSGSAGIYRYGLANAELVAIAEAPAITDLTFSPVGDHLAYTVPTDAAEAFEVFVVPSHLPSPIPSPRGRMLSFRSSLAMDPYSPIASGPTRSSPQRSSTSST